MILKVLLGAVLTLLLPLSNLKAQPCEEILGVYPEFPGHHAEQSSIGIAYERGASTGRLAATIVIGTLGVAIVAIALFNTNYCSGHHRNCHSGKRGHDSRNQRSNKQFLSSH